METEERRRMVCRACNVVMDDLEPMDGYGEFFHPTKYKDGKTSKCKNAGILFRENNYDKKLFEPFMRKRVRRAVKRTEKR